LICKFMGIKVSLPFLESWAYQTRQLDGYMEVILVANGYFLCFFLEYLTKTWLSKEALIFVMKWVYSSNFGMWNLILYKNSPHKFMFEFIFFNCPWSFEDLLRSLGNPRFFASHVGKEGNYLCSYLC